MRKRDSVKTRERILQAARRLFAEQDIGSVGIRDIAKAAGVSHGLVQRYFGTREEMVAEIVHVEVRRFAAPAPSMMTGAPEGLEGFRERLRSGQAGFVDFARIVVRAELAGLEPGKMLERNHPTPAMMVTELIRQLRRNARREPPALDPALVSAYVNASLFAFAALSPWLMRSVGLEPEDYPSKLEEINEISVALIAVAAGVAREAPRSQAPSQRAGKAARSSPRPRVKK
jgi:AcrR family transcriptional regulator